MNEPIEKKQRLELIEPDRELAVRGTFGRNTREVARLCWDDFSIGRERYTGFRWNNNEHQAQKSVNIGQNCRLSIRSTENRYMLRNSIDIVSDVITIDVL